MLRVQSHHLMGRDMWLSSIQLDHQENTGCVCIETRRLNLVHRCCMTVWVVYLVMDGSRGCVAYRQVTPILNNLRVTTTEH